MVKETQALELHFFPSTRSRAVITDMGDAVTLSQLASPDTSPPPPTAAVNSVAISPEYINSQRELSYNTKTIQNHLLTVN